MYYVIPGRAGIQILSPAQMARAATDDVIRLPLWRFDPRSAKAILHERRRRFGDYNDPPVPDPDYR